MATTTTNVSAPATSRKTTKKAPAASPATKPTKAQVQPKAQEKAKPVATKGKEAKLCLTGSGQPCKKEFAGLGSDARYKSRLIHIATGKEPTDLPTTEQLKKLGYSEDRIKLVPHKGMSMIKATEIIAIRGWSSHLIKRQDKLKGKTVGQAAKKIEKNARK